MDRLDNRAKNMFEYICPKYNITLLEWNHDMDHVHILFKSHPGLRVFLITTGESSVDIIREYIETQGEKVR